MTSHRFCMFDYESQEMNMMMYGETSPPDYNLAMVRCPVLLYWGENDWLAHPKDVSVLAAQLPNLVASIRVSITLYLYTILPYTSSQVPYDSWNHNDFLWAKDADTLLYGPALRMMTHYQTL